MNLKRLFLLAIVAMACGVASAAPDYKDSNLPIEKRVEDLLKRMTLEEKADYVSGMRSAGVRGETWDGTPGNERLGIRPFKIYHGPYGIGSHRYAKKNGVYYPSSINMATSWDRALVEEITTSMGSELKASGGQSSAGPAMNIIRDLRSGRSMEYFTEDPYLNGEIAAAYTKGVQKEHNFAIMKHFLCNNQEFERFYLNVNVSERALREIYLPGYKACVDAGVRAVMTGYNSTNGIHNSAQKHQIQEILKDEWGFEGVVMTDWAGSAETLESMVNAGLDLEMPRPNRYKVSSIVEAVKSGKIKESQIDDMLRRILYLTFWCGVMDREPVIDPSKIATAEAKAVARKGAEQSIVLLKNEAAALPVDRKAVKRIAVIGPNGEYGAHFRDGQKTYQMLQGGGSASIVPAAGDLITPYAGIKRAAGEGIEVLFEPGCYGENGCGIIPSKYLTTLSGEQGLDAEYYANTTLSGKAQKKVDKKLSFWWHKTPVIIEEGSTSNKSSRDFSVKWSGKLTAPVTREYKFELSVMGEAQLYIDGKLIAEHESKHASLRSHIVACQLTAAEHDIEVRYKNVRSKDHLSLSWDYENDEYLQRALEVARTADVVVMTMGTSGMLETESTDRAAKLDKSDCLALSSCQERLINEVAKVNKRVAVVTYTAGVVCEAWRDAVPSIIYAGFPGQEGATALGSIIFGDVNPSGHLTVSIPKSSTQFPESWHTLSRDITYDEGIFVGYRYFDRYNKQPAFAFGHGLSYTTFDYGTLKVKKSGDKFIASLPVTNSGKVAGREVVQLYIGDIESSLPRPAKELKGFEKIALEAGESRVVSFTIDESALSYFDDTKNKWVAEKGRFRVMVGSSSADIRSTAEFDLK